MYNKLTLISFPSWERIERESTEEFISFSFKQCLGESLFLCIERRKGILGRGENADQLHFSFCSRTGSPIAFAKLPATEEGYKEGIFKLLSWAEMFGKVFADIRDYSKIEEKGEKKND